MEIKIVAQESQIADGYSIHREMHQAETRGPIVVGIGASAGGVEVAESLFAQMPSDTGMSFVLCQHLAPQRPSLLAELLARQSQMPVREAQDGMRLEPNEIYVVKPGTHLTVREGVLRAAALSGTDGPPSLIDVFFRSLAEDLGERAVAVILSGAGSDGAAGVLAVKRHGGLVVAQSPESAKFDMMPRSVIATGVVDAIVQPDEIPAKLLEWAAHLGEISLNQDLAQQITRRLGAICETIRRQTGHDFSRYKRATLVRRIQRRLLLRQLGSLAEYVAILEHDAEEVESLLKDLLIGVTQFFRDPEVFESLARSVIPQMLEGRTPETPLRVWVPGCASGEEAYSIAILLRERMLRTGSMYPVHIFATDIDVDLLAAARKGNYPERIAEQVSPDRLERFFTKLADGYQANPELRAMCVFSAHNVLRDPPFSSLDLISCRNLLIYLEVDLQQKLTPLFHYALRPSGFLLLGPSEGVTGHPELFRVIDKSCRLFQRNDLAATPAVAFPLSATGWRPLSMLNATPSGMTAREKQQGAGRAFERLLLEQFAPASVMINEQGEVLYFSGPTNRYLRHPLGASSVNLFDLAHDNLRLELRRLVRRAITTKQSSERAHVLVEVDGEVRPIRIVVRPLSELREDSGLLAVIFQEQSLPAASPSPEISPAPAERALVQHLEGELRVAREELQSVVEELESANEELRSSNEELITTNEELQSANEELQTSKEELQSANEELETVNAELNRRVAELDAANSDLQNFFASTQIATLFLDRSLRIHKFTPAANVLFNLRESDVGRPISDLAPKFTGADLLADIEQVAQTLATSEKQVKVAEGPAWFMVRILPYRTVDHVIAGVVVNFVDITQLKRAEIALRQSEQRFATAFRSSPAGILLADLSDGRILDINDAGTAALGCSRVEALARTTVDFGLWCDDTERREAIQQLQESSGHAWRKEAVLTWPSGEKRFLDVRFEWIELENRPCFLVICNDITSYREALDDLREERQALLRLTEMHEHDRQLTAFEIHDGLAQMLFGAKCQLEALEGRWPAETAELRKFLAEGLEQVRAASREARRLMNGLRPTELDAFGAVKAVDQWLRDQQTQGGPTVDFSHQLGEARLAPLLENAVFRIVQEAVSNARRHSQSDRVQVELMRDGDWLRLRVEDWGLGFDAVATGKNRFGLRGIKERARLLDGRCHIDTAPGRGTRIVVELPFVAAVTAEAEADGRERIPAASPDGHAASRGASY